MKFSTVGTLVAAMAATTAMAGMCVGCGSNADEPYKPNPAWSGRKPSLPPVPSLPTTPIKTTDGYTVYGAIHQMRSSIHNAEVTSKEITVVGYIVDSNIATAPKCAVHKTGKKDPDDCKTDIPTFTIADNKGDTKGPQIKVMGWASNFANVFEALEKYKNLKEPPNEKQVYKDELWAIDVPFPLPAVGAKVKVTGKYGVNFSKSSSGIAADPLSGIITYTKIDVIEEAPEKAAFAKNDGKK
ncbi:hypothetical protein [Pendulispora albinea]|uniref:Lipoprotein n=1 Tax=Pendulispora albinea TaxID=2741071 RepID=A0ABZ2LRW8_9BACT